MALDNAQFISELSITDPPGTDAVAEGDDHIRTTKRATQQSFPNVDAAVPQTAAQMGQMAIKNEVNVFTQANNFAGSQQFDHPLFLDAVSGANDNVLFMRDAVPNGRWDIAFEATDTSGDFYIRRRDAAGASLDKPFQITAATGFATFQNTVTFQGDPTIFRNAFINIDHQVTQDSDRGINFQIDGVSRWSFIKGSFISGQDLKIQRRSTVGGLIDNPIIITEARGTQLMTDGRALDPAYSFQADTGMGMYRASSFIMGWAIGGVQRMTLSNQTLLLASLDQIRNVDGTSSVPGYSFAAQTNSGMFRLNSTSIGFSIAASTRMIVKSNTINMTLPSTSAGLSSGDCFRSSGFVAIV